MGRYPDLLRRNYERFTQPGGIPAVLETLHPDFELREIQTGEEPRVYRGHNGFLTWARQGMRTFSATEMTPTGFEEHGDTVLVTVHTRATLATSGDQIEMIAFHVNEMRDGFVWRMSTYLDQAEARAAAVASGSPNDDEARLRSFYSALSRPAGIKEVAENLDPEFELDEFSTGDTAKIYRGRAGFLQWGRRAMTSFSNATLTPLTIEEHGSKLLVDLQVKGTGAATGAPIDLVVHHVVELRDGRLYRIAGYLDRTAARAAATAG